MRDEIVISSVLWNKLWDNKKFFFAIGWVKCFKKICFQIYGEMDLVKIVIFLWKLIHEENFWWVCKNSLSIFRSFGKLWLKCNYLGHAPIMSLSLLKCVFWSPGCEFALKIWLRSVQILVNSWEVDLARQKWNKSINILNS